MYAIVIVFNYSNRLSSISIYRVFDLIWIPVIIYFIRRLLTFYFNRLVTGKTERIKALQEEQKEKVEDLKQSTNFYSTKAILERFDASYDQSSKASKGSQQQQHGKLSGTATPLQKTAPKGKTMPQSQKGPVRPSTSGQRKSAVFGENFEFAPNLPSIQQPQQQKTTEVGKDAKPGAQSANTTASLPIEANAVAFGQLAPNNTLDPVYNVGYQPHWYDRILDMIVGEDEYSPKSRYALICENCRRHNGLAQPGELPQFVVYICPQCGYRNGQENTKKRAKRASHDNTGSESISHNRTPSTVDKDVRKTQDIDEEDLDEGSSEGLKSEPEKKSFKFDITSPEQDSESESESEILEAVDEVNPDETADPVEPEASPKKVKPNKHKRHHSINVESATSATPLNLDTDEAKTTSASPRKARNRRSKR